MYHTTSPNNKIGKTLTDESSYDCKFKKDSTCDVLNPVVYIYSENYIDFNFAYIEQFHRYYFVNNVVIFPNNIYKLELSVDVLDSYKDSILSSNVVVTQNTNSNSDFNSDFKNLETMEHTIVYSDTTIEYTKNIILVTLGG